MNRFVSFFLAAMFSASFCNAQNDKLQAAVRYTFLHVQDTTDRSQVFKENTILYLGQSKSVYKSLDQMFIESEWRRGVSDGARDANRTVNLTGRRFTPTTTYYKEPVHNTLTIAEVTAGKEYVYKENLPMIDWTVLPDTKIIQGFPCQKASGQFRERTYEAWFCNQLPYNNGPWKLGGLPGLILEAYDLTKEVVFLFAGFEKTTGPVSFEPAEDVIPTSLLELNRLKEAIANNPSALQETGTGSIKGDTNTKGPSTSYFKRKINNPIEKK